MRFNEATQAQISAAMPNENTWVTANAGSGKTHVLTNRVARLLLHGTLPQRILCLTYTKAAAAEMQDRLFQRLGTWAMMPDADLRQTLLELGEDEAFLDRDKLRDARRLFASALETPGGLKIQTIHAFCDAVLRRFPLEAGVAPQFAVMEDRQAKQLRSDIIEQMAMDDPKVLQQFARYFTGLDTHEITAQILHNRHGFARAPEPADFGISEGVDFAETCRGLAKYTDLLERLIGIMREGGSKDQELVPTLEKSLMGQHHPELKSLESFLLFGVKAQNPFGAKIDTVPSGVTLKRTLSVDQHPELRAQVNELALFVQELRTQRVAHLALEKTQALHEFAHAFLARYDAYKASRALMDFEDLIECTAQLLTESRMAQWVLYRLDGGLDHILVDEAQDTSPAQWRVIRQLAAEFTVGDTGRDAKRTLFVVGDEKQSIYSFQGADPQVFGEMKAHFDHELMQIQAPLQDSALLHSFRSSPVILDLVDQIFKGPAGAKMQALPEHKAFQSQKPGRIDIWPFIESEGKPKSGPWYQPLDQASPSDPGIQLAEQIAQHIHQTLHLGQQIQVGKTTRAVRPRDFLILFQSRGRLFHAVLKALKGLSVPVAGADRLKVGAELAVRDLLALLRFLALADDDLSLAEALRSPLLGLSEAELFHLAHGRSGTLWQSLRDSNHGGILDILRDLRAQSDFLRPYELIERILITHQGRAKLIARLGTEVEDGIDELLAQAMQYEQIEAPSLTGFLAWFEAGDVEIKREMDSQMDQVRLMTVHGSKGLEAPIVILPQTGQRKTHNAGPISIAGDLSVWNGSGADITDGQSTRATTHAELQVAERMRLLYVALTRAESWLVVCGAGQRGKQGTDWYDLISNAAKNIGGVEAGALTVQSANWITKPDRPKEDTKERPSTPLPDWITQQAAKLPRPVQPLAPSKMAGAKALPSALAREGEAAMLYGSQVHLLLEHLCAVPQERWPERAATLLHNHENTAEALAEARAILCNADFQFLFAPETLSEVEITADIPDLGGQRMAGVIDKLVISDTEIHAYDFKSNAAVPSSAVEVPAGILAQMGLYLLGLRQIYPQHRINISILWTAKGALLSIPHNIAIDAVIHAQHLDHRAEAT
ncbi:double-strand break repair helicase AddA [Amylibacter marinus]|uniref:DNA 3'-5' helicase n=1 Tax=Amylibacter marinus TaxID=1475483 RepID=A0ABQ5VWU4_9RHOB|nr:double-strand break repair helicase AddA [Amylibacter marinus]GLQ35614.1 double-strand break repair helicase AddA [Amylibacter marinus]